jgi:hypothetical protein
MTDLSDALMPPTPLYPGTNKHRRRPPFKEINKQLSDLLYTHLDKTLRFFLKASIEEESLAGKSWLCVNLNKLNAKRANVM